MSSDTMKPEDRTVQAGPPTLDKMLDAVRKLTGSDYMSLHQVAVHECGHAVVGLSVGMHVGAVTLTSTEVYRAAVMFKDYSHDNPEMLRHHMVMTCAGEIAQRLLAPDEDSNLDANRPMGATGDRLMVRESAVKLHGLLADKDTITAEVELAEKRAGELVRANADKILSAAAILLQFHECIGRVPRWPAVDGLDTNERK